MAYDGTGGAWYKAVNVIPINFFLADDCTIHLFFKAGSNASNANFRAIAHIRGSSTTSPAAEQLIWNHTAGGYNKAYTHGPDFNKVQLTSTPALNTWHSLAAWNNGTNIKIFLNGVEEASALRGQPGTSYTQHISLLGFTTDVGALDVSSQWADGAVAEFAYWNKALTADEIVSLSKGFRAPRVRPEKLQSYWPLVRGLNDIRFGNTMVKQAGSDVIIDHPRVFG